MATSVIEVTASPRRELATRRAGWVRRLARRLAGLGARPNAVSIAGVGFALASGAAFYTSSWQPSGNRAALLVAAAACIQLRLLCNLLDGMLAVEERLKSATGEIFNDLPDRVSDVVILAAAGYAIPQASYGAALGWVAAVGALLTAYVRVLGGSLGVSQHFIGPMAKQHRMFTLTLVALVGALEALLDMPSRAIPAGLTIIAVGSVVTGIRRTVRIAGEIEAR
jgi:phosphatidylglycerophosphate synthase